jgi:type I restriction enzyme S subunit
MSKNNGNKLVPKLRFPEFANSGEWEEKTLGSVAANVMYGMNSAAVEFDGENKYIRITDIDEDTRMFTPNPLTSPDGLLDERYSVNMGDLLFARTGASVGKSYLHRKESGKIYFAGFLIRVTIKDAVPYFIYAQTLTKHYQKWVLATSARSGQPGINAEEYKSYPILLPINNEEQQKIASCLSSLDEVITAERQKLGLLKEHKKGLLQNLFPQKGKTIPKFRFKEFVDSGDWEERMLTQVADYENGKAHEQDIDDTGQYIVVNSKFISQDGEVKKFTNTAFCPTTKGDVLMVLSDIPNGRAIAKCFLVEEDNLYTVNQRICRITPRNLNSKILYYLLNRNPYFLAFDDGVKQTNIRKEDVLNCPLLIPSDPKEQEKIANTLSSVDDLIITKTQKLNALMQHKKGLLQGLFPDASIDVMYGVSIKG